jgi:hypothetical protein
MAVLKMSSSILAWGDNSVSSCGSHSRAKGPGTSAGAFPVHSMARFLVSRLYGGAMAVLKMSSSLLAWGDNSVSSCRSHSRAKGPGTSAGASSMDMARSLCGEGRRGGGLKQSAFCMARRKTMITMGSPDFVWINANEIISSWRLLGAGCVAPPRRGPRRGAKGTVGPLGPLAFAAPSSTGTLERSNSPVWLAKQLALTTVEPRMLFTWGPRR